MRLFIDSNEKLFGAYFKVIAIITGLQTEYMKTKDVKDKGTKHKPAQSDNA